MNKMTNWTENLSTHQVQTVRRTLAQELRIADHVQSNRSTIDGWATVDVFIGRRCYTVTIGPKGGLKSKETNFAA
jgi:hypothetical protein